MLKPAAAESTGSRPSAIVGRTRESYFLECLIYQRKIMCANVSSRYFAASPSALKIFVGVPYGGTWTGMPHRLSLSQSFQGRQKASMRVLKVHGTEYYPDREYFALSLHDLAAEKKAQLARARAVLRPNAFAVLHADA
jgi:hypothetical protein